MGEGDSGLSLLGKHLSHSFPACSDSCSGEGSMRSPFGCGLLSSDVVADSEEEGKGDSGFRQKERCGTIHKYFTHPLKTRHIVYASWHGCE